MPAGPGIQPGLTPPPSENGMGYEILRNYSLYDTQAITTAQQAVPTFFATIQSDVTLGNLPSQSQLPDGWYFDVDTVYATLLVLPSLGVGTIAGAINDIANIYQTCRAVFGFTYNDKSYGTRPLASIPPDGTPQGFYAGTLTAPQTKEVGWAGPVGGFCGYLRGLRIAPKTKFQGNVSLAVAPTLAASPLNLRLNMVGTLWRKVT